MAETISKALRIDPLTMRDIHDILPPEARLSEEVPETFSIRVLHNGTFIGDPERELIIEVPVGSMEIAESKIDEVHDILHRHGYSMGVSLVEALT